MPLGCLAEETQQDIALWRKCQPGSFQNVLREEECQAGMAFLGYIGEENVSAQDILGLQNRLIVVLLSVSSNLCGLSTGSLARFM